MSSELRLVGRAVQIAGSTLRLDREHNLRKGDLLAASHMIDVDSHLPLRPGRLAVAAVHRDGRIDITSRDAIAPLVIHPEWGDWLYLDLRSPVEHYIRCSVTVGGVIVEPGLEMREGDDLDRLSGQLAELASAIGAGVPHWGAERALHCASFGASFGALWPGRAWFVELHDAKLERWTQSYQPYGVPRAR